LFYGVIVSCQVFLSLNPGLLLSHRQQLFVVLQIELERMFWLKEAGYCGYCGKPRVFKKTLISTNDGSGKVLDKLKVVKAGNL